VKEVSWRWKKKIMSGMQMLPGGLAGMGLMGETDSIGLILVIFPHAIFFLRNFVFDFSSLEITVAP
jgi:hypothetical protein